MRVNAPQAIYKDYFGTGRSDFVRNSVVNNNIVWSVLRNPPGAPAQTRRFVFGLPTDTIIYGDFDGDLRQDIAVYREGTTANPQSYFYILPSTSPNTFISQPWGTIGDKPVTGDFDGDGKTDFCVARRANNQIVWIILPSGGGAVRYVPFGLASDRENSTAADFNGDGRDDLIVTRTEPNGNLTHYVGDASSGALCFERAMGKQQRRADDRFLRRLHGRQPRRHRRQLRRVQFKPDVRHRRNLVDSGKPEARITR
ncbi:MAG: VCBS repeat-containing protein [Pyrinomonadaceae bacterium]